MLRASIETTGGEVDLSGLTDASSAEASPVRGAGALVGFVEATLSAAALSAAAPEIAKARDRVRNELGSEALVDAAAIIGNFERMTRIADGTGIPLDVPVRVATESLRSELGLDRFESAAHTPAVRGWQRGLGRALEPILKFGLRWAGRRSKRVGEDSQPGA